MIALRSGDSASRGVRLVSTAAATRAPRNNAAGAEGQFALSDNSMVPLINLVFLLIVFFLIAGTLTPKEMVVVQPPVSTSAQREVIAARSLVLQADGQLWWQGQIVAAADLVQVVEQIRQATSAFSGSAVTPLQLRADAGVPVALLKPVLAGLRAAGVTKIKLVTQPAR